MNDDNRKEMPGVVPDGTPAEVPTSEPKDVPEMPRKEMPFEKGKEQPKGNPDNISDPDVSGGLC